MRTKGPRSIKPIEFISQLPEYQKRLGWNWMEHSQKFEEFIDLTLNMLDKSEKITDCPSMNCEKCEREIKPQQEYIWRTKSTAKGICTIADIIHDVIQTYGKTGCCLKSLKTKIQKEKILVIGLSSPTDILLSATDDTLGMKIKYTSHIETISGNNQTFFCHRNEMLYQDSEDNILQSSFGEHRTTKSHERI